MPTPPEKPDWIPQEEWDEVDSPPLTDEQLAAMRPAREVMPAFVARMMRDQHTIRHPNRVVTGIPREVFVKLAVAHGDWRENLCDALVAWIEGATAEEMKRIAGI